MLQSRLLLAATVLLDGLESSLPKRLRKYILDAIDEIDFSSSVVTPLIEYKPPLRCVVILINSFDN